MTSGSELTAAARHLSSPHLKVVFSFFILTPAHLNLNSLLAYAYNAMEANIQCIALCFLQFNDK